MTRLSLGFQVFVDTSFCSKLCSFEAFYLDISFVLRWFFILRSFSSHLFLLTYSYFASKTHPVNYKTCTKSFLHQKTCTKYFPVTQYYFVLQSLHKVLPSATFKNKTCTNEGLPSTTSYYQACTKYFAVLLSKTRRAQTKDFRVLLCTAKLAQSTSQCYFQKQDLHRQRTSEYHFVLQSLHKVLPSATLKNKTCADKGLPSTTLYCKAGTKYFPVLLSKTRLAQTKDFRVLPENKTCTDKGLPSTTSYCKACTDKIPATKHRVSCDFQPPSVTWTKQFHCDCDLPSLPCKSQCNCVNVVMLYSCCNVLLR